MNQEIYNELREINEFHGNFIPSEYSKNRKKELLNKLLDNLYKEHDMLWDNDRLVQAFDCKREINKVQQELSVS